MAFLKKGAEAHKKKKHPASETDQQAPDQEAGPEAGGGGDEQPGAQGPSEQQDSSPPPAGGGSDDQDDSGGPPGEQQPAAGGDQEQQGGGQGQPPIKNPQAPGAGDDSFSEDTGPSGDTEGGETPGESSPAGTGSEGDLQQVPISKGLQEEYERVDQAVQQELYGPSPTAQHVVETLHPDGKAKVQSVVMMTLVLTRGIYKKTQFPIQIAAHIMHDIAGRVMELGQEVKGIQYSDQEATMIIGAVMEGGMRIFGVSNKHVQNLKQLVGSKALAAHAQNYHGAITAAQQGMQQGQPVPGTGGQPAGPQSGAPAGATAAPATEGAPAQEPPPPGGPQAPEEGGGGEQ